MKKVISEPIIPKNIINPKFLKNRLVFKVNPAENIMGGSKKLKKNS
jgi:hypothetical protein